MLNVRIPGRRSPVRVICDSSLRIPLDSQICRTAKDYPTIIAWAPKSAEDIEGEDHKIKELERLGIQVLAVPDGGGRVDMEKLMQNLGGQGIDSILLEGGGTLNDSALRAGIVQEVLAFIAPKIFGGEEARTSVAGIGAKAVEEAVLLQSEEVSQIGEDLLVRYKVKYTDRQVSRCLQEL